jgi:ABC-type branched-subunit amino acid transport system substrate-binding protein
MLPQNMTKHQIGSLASEAVTGSSPLARSLAMSKLLESLSTENALSVMAALEENRADGDDWELLRYAWASIDPEGALADALSLEGRRQRDALEDTITGWTSKSPDDAMAWVNALEDAGDRERNRNRLMEGMADHDIGNATTYVIQLAEHGDKRAGRYLESVTREQLRKGPVRDAARWAEDLADGKLKGQAMDSVAGRFVSEDPAAAAA